MKKDSNYLINKWFSNLLEGRSNEEILFICNIEIFDVIEDFLSKKQNAEYKILEPKERIFSDSKIKIVRGFDKNLTLNKSNSFLNFPLLVINSDLDIKNIKKLKEDSLEIKKEFYYYARKYEPIDFIKDRINELEFFLFHSANIKMIESNHYYFKLFEGINIEESEYERIISEDIKFFLGSNIITSRLITIVYRVLKLDLSATTTESGRYFKNKTNVRSKIFNKRTLSLYNNVNLNLIPIDLRIKNFRAYDLSVNDTELKVKKEIARKLLYSEYLNIDKISEVTDLSISEIKKL
ncbi:hypothetical protein CRV03_07300 [Arcobacter sp. F155]|uniref:hypothetical protein n=1 Tax=Arcobacter sp. F155 TaxID=2044512 RepID=UPI00100ABE2B|nr:hypothetical protein [Arcobacter sp. F155]RXJ77061.1 hypothetical protein CRV03_07300 [Arcobacter sp. F155]